MIDVDEFKRVNDTYGHEQGNVVLTEVAKILKSGVRMADCVARYAGDEFSLILFNCKEEAAYQVLEKIRRAVAAHPFAFANPPRSVSLSIGVCSNRHAGVETSQDLIQGADRALYQAKGLGRNRVCVYDETLPGPAPG